MRTVVIAVVSGLLAAALPPAAAQLTPAPRKAQAVADPALVFEDRGQKLEIFAHVRATARKGTAPGTFEHHLYSTSEAAQIGAGSLGVVFNHALQAPAFLTGEITFKPRADTLPPDMDAARYPGLAKLTNPNIWLVVASTPKDFVALFNHLKARDDLEWVEAVVTQGAVANQAALQAARRK